MRFLITPRRTLSACPGWVPILYRSRIAIV
jgi:hypothetical protein